MNVDELRAEMRAITDLHQRLGDHIETLARRLYRHLAAKPDGSKTDRRLTMTSRRDDEDDYGSD